MDKKFAVIVLCCLGVIIYSNTFSASFHFDDELSIGSNLSIRSPVNLKAIWNFWPTRFLTYLSIALNYRLQQFNVFGYHLFNLAIHLVTAILVFGLALLTLATPAIKNQKISRHANLVAFFAGLIFLAHPIQTQAVTYIIQRATCLATLFYLASLNLYIKSRLTGLYKPESSIGKLYLFCALILAALAMFTKEMAITLPLAVLLYEFCFFKTGKNFNWKQCAPFLITLLIIPLTMWLTKSANFKELRLVSEPSSGISPWVYLVTQFRVMATYLRLAVLPLNQNLDYDYPLTQSFLDLPFLASALLLGIILFMAIRAFNRNRLVSFAIFWFFLALLPESSIVPIKDVIFEHRLYLPMAGFSFFAAAVLHYFFAQKSLKAYVLALVIIVACYSFLTYNRNFVWKDEFSLWNDVISKSPRKARSYTERGNAYRNKGDLTLAIADYSKAIEVDPGYANAYNNRGITYLKIGDLPQALSDCNKAIQLNPKSPFFYYNLGSVHKKIGDLKQSIADYSQAIAINPNFALAYHNRGSAYQDEGDLKLAIGDYSKAIQIEPNLAITYYSRGNAYLNINDLNNSVSDYTKAIRIEPNLVGAYSNRAKAFFLKQEYQKSREDVSKVRALGYDMDPAFLERLDKISDKIK